MHSHMHFLAACVQIQTKPYGPPLSSFTPCNPGADERLEEPATPISAGCGTEEQRGAARATFALPLTVEIDTIKL